MGLHAGIRARALLKLLECESCTCDTKSGEFNGDQALEAIVHCLPVGYSSNASRIYTIPLTVSEWEVLCAASEATPVCIDRTREVLREVIVPYLRGAPRQRISEVLYCKFRQEGLRNPVEILTYQLSKFTARASKRFPDLEEQCLQVVQDFLHCFQDAYQTRPAALLAFYGFLNAFVIHRASQTLVRAVWEMINSMFRKTEMLKIVDTISISPETFSNDTFRDYVESGNEICAAGLLDLLAKLTLTMISELVSDEVGEGRKSKSLDELLLEWQSKKFKEFNERPHGRYFLAYDADLLFENKDIDLLTRVCQFSLEFIPAEATLDLSNKARSTLSLNAKARFIESLAIIPFMRNSSSEGLLESYADTVQDSIEKYLSSEVATVKMITSIITASSLLNYFTERVSLIILRTFPLLVTSPNIETETVRKISRLFTLGLVPLREDAIVSTIYSIHNQIATDDNGLPLPAIRERQLTISSMNGTNRFMLPPQLLQNGTTNLLSQLPSKNDHTRPYHERLFRNCVAATTTISSFHGEARIIALTLSTLTQKLTVVSKELDDLILEALAYLAPFCALNEFTSILKILNSLASDVTNTKHESTLGYSVNKAKVAISKELLCKCFGSETYKLHLHSLLDMLIATGEVEKLEHHRSQKEIKSVANQISSYLEPLAAALPGLDQKPLDISQDVKATNAFRNVWFNMVVHGFNRDSEITKRNLEFLKIIAHNSPPLASNFPSNNKEMSFEMNTILCRGSSNENIKAQKHLVIDYAKGNVLQAKTISVSKLMFLATARFLEGIRCEAGDCSRVILYFSDPAISSGLTEKWLENMGTIMINSFITYVQSGESKHFNSKTASEQLYNLLLCLPHGDPYLQSTAFKYCNIFIKRLPSTLCHHHPLYTLLDLLSVLFESMIDSQTNKYQPRYEYTLKHSGTQVKLSGSTSWRSQTLSILHKSAKDWVLFCMEKAPKDIKILLQSYIFDIGPLSQFNRVDYGVSFAMEMAGTIVSSDKELYRLQMSGLEQPNIIASFMSQHSWKSRSLINTAMSSSLEDLYKQVKDQAVLIRSHLQNQHEILESDISSFLDMCSAILLLGKHNGSSLVHELVHIPFEIFTPFAIQSAVNIWLTLIKERSDLAHKLLMEICYCWIGSVDQHKGLFSHIHDITREEYQTMEYAPYDKKSIDRGTRLASNFMKPHRYIISFFVSHFEGTLYQSDYMLKIFTKSIFYGIFKLKEASLHPFANLIRNELLLLGAKILRINIEQQTFYVKDLCEQLVDGALTWFKKPLSWPYGSNELKIKADCQLMLDLFGTIKNMRKTLIEYCGQAFIAWEYFLVNEIRQIQIWLSPLEIIDGVDSNEVTPELVTALFEIDPMLSVNLVKRYKTKKLDELLITLISLNPFNCVHVPEALGYLLRHHTNKTSKLDMSVILYWKPLSPVESIKLFLPKYNSDSFVLQFAMYSLESHDVGITFFYVPQIVQCLRYDYTGYVEKLIIETGKISVLFSHQIIWNMLANSYKDDEGLNEDDLKPKLDAVRQKMVSSFSPSYTDFYQKEFEFFNEVTGISGKLKPYIKKSKAEKKQKIDEEMAKIDVKAGVYLPSNPDGVVVDIDRKSGKPLQSHAKAPFMATFKIKKDVIDSDTGEIATIEKWQAAIFKVGDDCRQDVLALQLISLFRSIWSNIGLDIYVFPYRVTATAPGCGVIDVLPNSISRDMLGREAVNGLYEYFITKFGHEESIEFQNARNNFVKSLAGYSVISYLLQFKDRHNGNIMYDDQGHCLHIDFGFIFDIVPGGIKFEAVPFKLTKEMVKVMGGSPNTPAYKEFEELCIKAYLAARPHVDMIIGCVEPLLDSGLPCFKSGKTIKNLRSRFQLQKSEQEAAVYMKSLIEKSFESIFTVGYDEFQRITNGIPY